MSPLVLQALSIAFVLCGTPLPVPMSGVPLTLPTASKCECFPLCATKRSLWWDNHHISALPSDAREGYLPAYVPGQTPLPCTKGRPVWQSQDFWPQDLPLLHQEQVLDPAAARTSLPGAEDRLPCAGPERNPEDVCR